MKSQTENIMKQFNLEEYLANPLRKVVTRDGRNVKIHCTNYNSPQPIIAEIEGSTYSSSFWKNGRVLSHEDSHGDLFFATEKHEMWVNVYKRGSEDYALGADIYISKELAEMVAGPNCVKTVKIEWEE